MPEPMVYDFRRYLAAKKTVDDRALNRHVRDTLERHLRSMPGGGPLRVLEVGAGIGTMAQRMANWDLFHGRDVHYTLLDADEANILEARRRLAAWAATSGQPDHGTEEGPLFVPVGTGRLHIEHIVADALTFHLDAQSEGRFDLLIASAFLDLVNIPDAMTSLWRLLGPGSLYYFTITYDGITAFEPSLDAALEENIEHLYHADMDARRSNGLKTGGSRAGRELLRLLAQGQSLLAVGASDWVVYPGPFGYEADEAYFLHFILHTMEKALAGHPALDGGRFAQWLATRHAQVEDHQLIYIAHQLDVLGRLP